MHRMLSKTVSIILVMLMILGGLNGVFVGGDKAYANHSTVQFAGGDGSEGEPYQIATPAQLDEVRNHLEEGTYFKLIADIDLSGYSNWTPIGIDIFDEYSNCNFDGSCDFNGSFDGNGFKIMNLTINDSSQDFRGLFGSTGSTSNLSNIILENVFVSGDEGVGGLVAESNGSISNSYVTGSVYGRGDVGGLVGYVYSDGGTINNSYSTANVTAYAYVGGLVGSLYSVTTITNSYATGLVTTVSSDISKVGGLVGFNPNQLGTITNSFYNSETTRQVDENKGLGISPVQMQTKNTFTGWNFDSDWYMLSGQYPQLWAFTYLTQGTNSGTTRLNNVATGMEYSIDGGIYNMITGTSVDNIYANVGDTITLRVTGTSPLSPKALTVDTMNRKPDVAIASSEIAGVTAPVRDATPVTTVTEATYYTGTITWSSSPVTFAGSTAYIATITLTPEPGYTFTGVGANFFTVVGAITTTNDANSGILTALFPATEVSSNADLSGLTLSSGTLSPVFSSGTTAYSANVANSVASLTLTANKTDINAVVTVNGTTVTSGLASGAINLNVGSNTITVVVTAQNGTPKTYTVTVTRSNSGSTPTPTSGTVTPTNGKLTVPAGSTGEANLEDKVTVSIPANATDKELILTIEEVLNTQNLLMNKEVLASQVYEILKNFSENFSKPVTLTFTFDPAIVKSNQRVAVFYYDEVKKLWVEVGGGVVSANKISVEVDHFTKFAVMAVDEVVDIPVTDGSTDTTSEISLSDISGHWAESGIKRAVSIGFIKGYVDGTFKPNQTVTRAEFSVMLMHALKPQEAGAELNFTDTAKIGAWAQKAVAQAVQAGVINGYEDGSFRPNAEVTRTEMAVMIANALKLSIESDTATGFADHKSIPSWGLGAVAELKKLGLMSGTGANQFNPNAQATRAEAVTVLLKMLAQQGK